MEYEEIIEAIGREAADLPPDVAERAAQAVLQTLAERLPRGEARRILAELPAELKPWVYTETDAEGFGIDEFLERVAKREGTDIETALRHARAVFAALGRALDADAVAHLAASLPRTFEPLVAEAQQRFWEIMPADEFWRRVGQRLGLDQTAARRVTEAVLETLDIDVGGVLRTCGSADAADKEKRTYEEKGKVHTLHDDPRKDSI